MSTHAAVSPAPTFDWRPTLVALTVVLLVLFGLYRETAVAMVRIWARSETFTHAFLVPPITLWLIWEKRHVLARSQPRPSLWLALPLAGIACAWLLGEMAAVNAVTQLAFTLMLILAVPLVLGTRVAWQIAFPLAFLLFAVPIGEFVMPKLMDWTAAITVMALRASGIPVYQEGLHFVIPSGRWSVVEACSGVRYLIASLTVGTLFAYLNYTSIKRRLVFVGVAILVPILANWMRAYIIVMLGHLSGNEIATGVDHLIYGWIFFGIVIMIMFAIGMRWRDRDVDAGLRPAAAAENSPAALRPTHLAVAAAVFAGVIAAPHAVLWGLATGEALPPPRLEPAMFAAGDWQLADGPLANWKPVFENPSAEVTATLRDGERSVGVYVAYYRQQNYQRKVISSSNALAKSEDKVWVQIERGTRNVTLDGQVVTVRRALLRDNAVIGQTRLVAWHWYWINGRLTASDIAGKVWLAHARLTGQGDDSAAIVIFAPEDQPGSAAAALQAYLAGGGSGSIAAVLANARGQR